jgi:AcrR family transcriptional regulator
LLAETGDARRLTLRGVAKRVGIAATSIYLHFPDVEHLAAAVAERCFEDLTAAEDAAERGVDDPAQALLARCRAYCRFALEHPGHYRVMVQADLSLVRADGFDQLPGRRAFGALVRAIERCLDAGLAPRRDPPARLAALVWSAEHGLVSLRMARPRFPWPPLDDLVDEAVRRLVGLDATLAADHDPP